MKRGQVGEVDKHAIRRKIEEKQVMIREQRKVRERLSRECADTIFHIASTESAIKDITTKHKELLVNKEDDFQYFTAASRREVHQLEGKCAGLQRIIASSDVVEREQMVLTARLAGLRADDEKEEAENARELDALKRNLFNARNDLENVFRTTLHDLNVAYQDQAFDAMVEEATIAREELPALRRDLRIKTSAVNRVMAKHGGSLSWAGCAKTERDLTDGFVKLQAQRGGKIRRSLRGQKGIIEREAKEMKDLGERLETFQAEAVELKAATAELKQLRTESARAHKEYIQARAWAETLVNKGPKALETELKRRKLVSLTAAAVASFKADRTEPGLDFAEEGAATTPRGLLGSEAIDSGRDAGHESSCSCSEDGEGEDGEEEEEEEEEEEKGQDGEGGSTGIDTGDNRHHHLEENENYGDEGSCYSQSHHEITPCVVAAAEARPPPERRDTLTLVTGREVGLLGADVGIETRSKKGLHASNSEDTADQSAVVPRDRRRHGTSRQLEGADDEECERMWRASLSGVYGNTRRVHNNTSGNNPGSNTNKNIVRDSGRNGSSSVNRRVLPSSAANRQQRRDGGSPESGTGNTVVSLSALAGVEDHITTAAVADCREGAANTAQATMASSPSAGAGAGAGAATAVSISTRLDKLPAEAIASMLLSQHEFGGGGTMMSTVDVLERARLWEQQQQRQRQRQRQRQMTKPSQSVPDLPYGFTDLGRRVNVRGQHEHRGVLLMRNEGLVGRDSSP